MDFNLNSSQENEIENHNEIVDDYNEIEVSSQNSLDSELSSIDLDSQQHNVKRIKYTQYIREFYKLFNYD